MQTPYIRVTFDDVAWGYVVDRIDRFSVRRLVGGAGGDDARPEPEHGELLSKDAAISKARALAAEQGVPLRVED